MTFRKCFTLAALVGALMVGTNSARADFNYTSTTTPSPNTFGSSTISFTPGANVSPLTTPTSVSLGGVVDVSTATAPGDSTTINYSIKVTITNSITTGPGTNAIGTLTIPGTLTVTSNNTGQFNGSNSFGVSSVTALIGGVTYTIDTLSFTPPTPNGTNGAFGARITSTVITGVPEPASMVMLGSGLIGVIGVGLRRNKGRVGARSAPPSPRE
jgi:hypothetical protein